MNRVTPSDPLAASIFEDALARSARSEDSLAELIARNNIEVRDVIILSFVCDQHQLSVEQLMRLLGLERDEIVTCLKRLQGAAWVRYQQVAETAEDSDLVRPTRSGLRVIETIFAGQ